VTKGREGEVWVGTSRGLNRIDRSAAGSRYSVPAWPGLGDLIETEIRALLLDNAGQLWIGTPKGLAVIDPWSGRSRRFRHEPRNPRSLSEDSIHVIRQDTAGAIWVGTLGAGLNRFDAGTGSFTRYRVEDEVGLPGNTIEALYTDRHRRLWVGTNAGVVTLDESTSGARRFVRPTPASDALASAKILAFGESAAADGAMWIGTEQRGLIRLDGSGSAKFLTTANSGLPDNTIYGIATDRRGRLWLSTNRGVALYDPGTDVFQRFGLDRNLQSNEFNARASFVAEDGEIFFGGVGGLNTFYPDDVQVSPPPARVWVMAATARDRNQEGQAAARTIYRRGLPSAKARVAFGERDLAFEFVAPRYGDGQIKYFYRLDPHDAFWHGPVDARRAEYANLGPGDYTFRVRAVGDAASGDGPVDAVAFTVLPPFYSTWWFRAVGLAVLTLTIGGAYRLRTRALHQRRAELEQEVTERTEALHQATAALEQQARQLRTLDEAKSAFFANTSHDFRTPLTLTLGPLRDILAGLRGPVPEPVRADVSHALANAEQMLEMVEQLLLLARFDAGQPDFRPVVSRLDACLRRVAERFEWLAAHVGIRFVVCLPDHAVWAEFDEEKIDRAVGNLLTNAFKFTPAGGTVAMTLSVADQAATVVVEDSGSGIPAEQRRQVFDRFYRASSLVGERPGTGLGLPIAQLFVELNRGTIEVTDGAGGGAAFVVRLPTLPEGPSSASQESHVSPRPHTFGETAIAALSALSSDRSLPADESGEATAADDRPTVLVVEDHADVRAYLRRHLETAYRVVEAASAEEALAGMAAEPPDVIVSDVMMPGMDGHAFCRAVRSNPETDHLPIILLTARAGQDDTLAGLGAGADEYVTKPFDPAELLTRVRGILRARERLRARYGRVGGAVAVVPGPAEVQSVESMFVERIRQILEERSHDENFDISALGVALGVSRAQLHRKTREILGTTPAEVLIQFRLARAAQLLASRAGNVGEVAYAVGFRNLSHFVKRFRQQHGQTPAAFAAAHSADSAS
jgi:signal transduction histidine kinase/DNA-binding response OmpR family regulator/ligand-binding sensor domain-containing protein